MKVSLLLLILCALPVNAAQYLNSAEAMCDGSDSTVLMCDDFEDGTWAESNCDYPAGQAGAAYAPNDGWCMTIYYRNHDYSTSNGTYGQGFNNAVTAGYAVCSGSGAVGTNCAATSADRYPTTGSNPRDPNQGMMGAHDLMGGTVREVYHRVYMKHLTGYTPGHEKLFGLERAAHDNYNLQMSYMPFSTYGFQSIPIQNQDSWQTQNQGNDLTLQNNHWYYIEQQIKLNTLGSANGEYRLWMDDCGTTGLDCTGSGTLRALYTNIQYVKNTDQDPNAEIGAFTLETWANEGSIGESYFDQMIVRTQRIGPMAVDSPSAPTNFRLISLAALLFGLLVLLGRQASHVLARQRSMQVDTKG